MAPSPTGITVRAIDVAVLVSGSGTNLAALIDHQGPYRIVLVVTDRPGCYALERARAAEIPTEVVEWEGDRDAFTADLCALVEKSGAEVIALAGFMRILGPEAMARFPDRILNIHPSLLPAFPGANAVAQALARGVAVTGVTVHFVDEEVDHGPIVAQTAVPVLAGDTESVLHARIQVEEHRLYPEVLADLAAGRIRVKDGRVVRVAP